MKVTVEKDLCIGCGLCESMCPDVFETRENVAVAKLAEVPEGFAGSAREAAEGCPVNTIRIS
jgi:ferredoxin